MSTPWPAEQRIESLEWAGLPGIRAGVIQALGPVLAGEEAARALTRLLRQHPGWTGPERTAAAEALFGVALWRRRLRHFAPTDSPAALLDTLVHAFGGTPSTAQRPPMDWPTRLSYPDWLATEFSEALGEEAEAFAAATNLPGPLCIRANRLRVSREALAERLSREGIPVQPSRHAPNGLFLGGRPNVLGLPSFQAGLFEVQDEGSQLVGQCVGAQPGDHVLDLCAGSGGKTLLLGAALHNEGQLDAFDIDHSALQRLEHRAARAGLGRSLRILRELPPGLRATHVLVDAPCSALGNLRRGPDVRWRLQAATVSAFPRLQSQLLDTAALHTRRNGRLVYATCTIRPAENQEVVAHFLAGHADFVRERAPVPEALCSPDGDLLTLPHRHGMDGFYAAVLRRCG